MTQIPACKECQHLAEDDFFYFCKFHYVEKPDYMNGQINKLALFCSDARKDENLCGQEGRNFVKNENYKEDDEVTFGLWYHFKQMIKELFL